MTKTISVSWRIDPKTKRLLELLAVHHGISQVAVIEMLIRKEARAQKVKDEKKGQDDGRG